MHRRRFYTPSSSFDHVELKVTLPEDEAHHLREVLRLSPGDDVYVFDGEGREFRCRVVDLKRHSAILDIVEEVLPASVESPLDLTVGVALLKGEKFDLVIQKTTELGVNRIIPVATKLADVHLKDGSVISRRFARWKRIAIEAAKQCGRAVVPEIEVPVSFASLIERGMPDTLRLLFSEGKGQSLDSIEPKSAPSKRAILLIGSEGGWADAELALAREHGWKVVTLGGRIMRAETAAIVVTALVQHLYGDLR